MSQEVQGQRSSLTRSRQDQMRETLTVPRGSRYSAIMELGLKHHVLHILRRIGGPLCYDRALFSQGSSPPSGSFQDSGP